LAILDERGEVVHPTYVHVVEKSVFEHGFEVASNVREETPLQRHGVVQSGLGGERRCVVDVDMATYDARAYEDETIHEKFIRHGNDLKNKVQEIVKRILVSIIENILFPAVIHVL